MEKSCHHTLVCSTTHVIHIPMAAVHLRVALDLLRTQPWPTCLSSQTCQSHEKKETPTMEQRRANKKTEVSELLASNWDTQFKPSVFIGTHELLLSKPFYKCILEVSYQEGRENSQGENSLKEMVETDLNCTKKLNYLDQFGVEAKHYMYLNKSQGHENNCSYLRSWWSESQRKKVKLHSLCST